MKKIAVFGGGRLGKAIESALRDQGNEVVIFSRRTGFDVTQPSTMSPRAGFDAVVEATDIFTQKFEVASDFFTASTRNINHWMQQSGVDTHLLVSIVNCEVEAMSSNGYYAAKALQEKIAQEENQGTVLVRSTLWYEFARQNIQRMRLGPFAIVPQMKVKPVSLEAVATVVAGSINNQRADRIINLCGPEVMSLWDMTRPLRNRGLVLSIPAPGSSGKAMRQGALLPGPEVEVIGPRFDEWLQERAR